jgi:hypothetical protein
MRIDSYVRKLQSIARVGPSFAIMAFLGRFEFFRKLHRAWTRRARPARLAAAEGAQSSALLEPVALPEVTGALKRDGVWGGLRLRPEVLAQMRRALDDHPCYGSGQREYAFQHADKARAERRFGRTFLQAHYYGLEHIHPAFAQIAQDRALKQIVAGYFGCEPVWTGTRVWWSYATDASEAQRREYGQAFHFDVDGYLAMNAFFYLTDVDASAGAHVCVLGSHRTKSLAHRWRPTRSRPDEEMSAYYGDGRIVELCGPAGYGFVEDPFCFHKGLHPHLTDRLVLQVRFALRDYKAGTERAHSAQLAGALAA